MDRAPDAMSGLDTDLLDALPHKAWVADADGGIVYLNLQGQRYTGREPDDLRGDAWLTTIHPDDVAATAMTWQQAVQTGTGYETEYRLRRADGAYRWHVDRGTPTFDAAGTVIRWVGTLSDVHERRMASRGLEAQDHRIREQLAALTRLRTLLMQAEQLARFGSWELELASETLRLSPGMQRLLGLDVDLVPLEAVLAFLDPDDLAALREADDLETSGDSPVRCRLRRPDGSRRYLEVRTTRHVGPDGTVTTVTGTAQDVTERVLAEEDARVWSEVAEHAPIALRVIAVDPATGAPNPDGQVVTNAVGRAVESPEDASVRGGPAQLARLHEAYRRAAAEGRTVDLGDLVREHATDGDRILRSIVYPLPRPGLVAIAGVDVTTRRRLEEERVHLLERTIDATETERRRIAEHLHDDAVQTLTAALLRIDGLLAPDGPTVADQLPRIRDAVDHAVRTMRLTILELAPVALASDHLGDAITAYAEQLLAPAGVAVSVELHDVDALPAPVESAAYRITQEALANAHQHAQAQQILIRMAADGDRLVGEVTDDGVGLVESGRRTGHLGLRLMHERAEACGGLLELSPGPGDVGTTVRFVLPLAAPDPDGATT